MSTHGLNSNPAILRRWSALSQEIMGADSALPADWSGWAAANPTTATHLAQRDPELVQLLEGSAPAGLMADALTGHFAPVPPDPAAQAEAAQAARIEQLMAANPWGVPGRYLESGEFIAPVEPNLTAQLELATLAPDLYAQQQAIHQPQPTAEATHAAREAAAQADAAARTQSMQLSYSHPTPIGA